MGVKVRFVEQVPTATVGRKPDSGNKTRGYARAAKVLRKNPERWAQVEAVRTKGQASYAANHLRKHGLQVAKRKVAGGWYKIYARYIPTAGK